MNRLQELFNRIEAQNPDENEVVVSLDEFFAGNEDPASIGPNLGAEQPLIAEFYSVFQSIRDRPDVQDVLVRITECIPDEWPFADTVYILSSASKDEIESLVAPLKPDDVVVDWMYGKPLEAPGLAFDTYIYSVWWD